MATESFSVPASGRHLLHTAIASLSWLCSVWRRLSSAGSTAPLHGAHVTRLHRPEADSVTRQAIVSLRKYIVLLSSLTYYISLDFTDKHSVRVFCFASLRYGGPRFFLLPIDQSQLIATQATLGPTATQSTANGNNRQRVPPLYGDLCRGRSVAVGAFSSRRNTS